MQSAVLFQFQGRLHTTSASLLLHAITERSCKLLVKLDMRIGGFNFFECIETSTDFPFLTFIMKKDKYAEFLPLVH